MATKERLNKDLVVEQALMLADADGRDALTIRRLAQHLDVTPMALYWHFRSKDDLLEGLSERVWSEIRVNVDDVTPWPELLRAALESLIAVLRSHPAAPWLLVEHEKRNEAALHATENALAILAKGGFGVEQAAALARITLNTGIMLVNSEPGRPPGVPEAEIAEHLRRDRIELSLLPPDTFPRVIEAACPLTSCDDPGFHYQLGVSGFIAGVEVLAARNQRPDGR